MEELSPFHSRKVKDRSRYWSPTQDTHIGGAWGDPNSTSVSFHHGPIPTRNERAQATDVMYT